MPNLTNDQLAEKIGKAIEFETSISKDMSGAFALIVQGFFLMQEQSSRPDIKKQILATSNMMSGAMIVYLFAMWEQHFEHNDIQKYFSDDEKRIFCAFKHIRHVFAHNVFGKRHGNKPGQDRMKYAAELDYIMNSDSAYDSIKCTKYQVNLSFPGAFLDCQTFLSNMSRLLASERFSIIGASNKIRRAGTMPNSK